MQLSRPTRFLATLALGVLLAVMPSLSLAGQTLAATSVAVTPAATPLMALPDDVTTGVATNLGAFAPTQMLRLAIALRPPHLAEEEQLLRDLQDRNSPLFHHYLTPDEWNARFAPSAQDEQAVVDWANAQGLNVTQRYSDRLDVDVAAPVSAINRAFGIQISNFRRGTTTFWSADRQPTIPATLQPTIGSVMGLSSLEAQHSGVKGGPTTNLGSSDPYSPGPVLGAPQSAQGNADPAAVTTMRATLKARDAQRAAGVTPRVTGSGYDPTDLYSSFAYDWDALDALGHCCNPLHFPADDSPAQGSIAIVTGGAISFNDIAGFQHQYPYLAYNVTTINVDGTPSCCSLESTLDTEWATAMANSFGCACSTAHVWVYQAPTSGTDSLPINRSFDMMNDVVNDHHADAYSTSFGCSEELCFGDSTMDSWHAVFNNMLGIGMSLTADAGDNGTTDTCDAAGTVEYPASDPDVTSAGGTTAQFAGGFQSEVAWNGDGCDFGLNGGGTGGGCSKHWSEPFYQIASAPNLCNGMRMVPDVALNASISQNIVVNGALTPVIGTSIVAPELAGFFAQQDSYLLWNSGQVPFVGGPIGEANVGFYSSRFHGAPHNPYYDVTSGCQGGSGGVTGNCATAGFDLATGWGSFNALQMAWQFNWNFYPGSGVPGISFTGPAVNQWYNTDQTISWNLSDTSGSSIAGYTARDNFDPGDPTTHATPRGIFDPFDPFYQGPETKSTSGSLTLSSLGEGQHTINVRAWNNMGESSLGTYGFVGYDVTPPVTTASLAGTPAGGGAFAGTVTVTLTGTDSLSGVNSTVFRLDGGPNTPYGAPFTVSGVGQHLVTYQSTDNAGNLESSQIVTFTIASNRATITTVSGPINPTVFGQAVTFTASVAPQAGSGTPTGTVTFKDGANILGTPALNSSGSATFTTGALAVGAHSLTAVYGGDSAFGGSSAAIDHTVNRAGTTTTLTSSANPSVFGQPVTFTATVRAAAPGAGVPTGSVTFRDGATVLGTTALSGNGVATFTTGGRAVGAHSLTAVFNGSASFIGSTSAALGHTVNRANTTTTLTGSINPSVFGQPVTFTAAVRAAAPGAGVPAGSVTFRDGTTVLGTTALTGNGIATFATGALAAGTHSLTAVFNGSTSFIGSTSAALGHTVNRANTTTTLSSSVNPSVFGQPVAFTATVRAVAPGAGIPSGSVTFKDGTTVLGTVALGGAGTASFATGRLAVGTHTITASYAGDGHFTVSSGSVPEQITSR